MRWASAISTHAALERAAQECAASLKEQLQGEPPDMVCAFVSAGFADRYDEAGDLIRRALPAPLFFGCSGGGVIGAGREVERRPALSLAAARLPGAVLKAFCVQDEDLPDLDASPRAWEELTGVKASENPHFILLADPFSIRADNLVMGLDYAFPKAVKVGGLASGAAAPGGNAIYLNELCLRSGALGVAFVGDVELEALVAQGCKPIGKPLSITGCRGNVLLELDRRPPLEVLQEVADGLDPEDRELARSALFLGLATDPAKTDYGRGDFLIRNIIGADPSKGLLAVGAVLRPGQTAQFHLRDARASAEDLSHVLSKASAKDGARGALLFSCLGRGQDLYGVPDHDSRLFSRRVGPLPLAGFFCNGEIGPVGGTTYLHGYTSCFGLFRPKSGAPEKASPEPRP
ncbi:MAG: FIST signal transduction protein [Elusimicrobiota bacterium]